MNFIKFGIIGSLAATVMGGCGSSTAETKESKNYSETNSTIKEVDSDQTAEFATIAEKHIKEIYSIDNLKMDLKSIKVTQFPDDKNAETGEEYKNIYNGIGDFTWQDKKYNFSFQRNRY